MAIESNIFQWIGGSIDMTLNSFVQTTSANVITSFVGTFTIGGGLFFAIMGLMAMGGYIEAPVKHLFKSCFKWVLIGGLALSSTTYMGWVVEALRGLETGMADAFSATGSATAATSVYQVLDKAVTDGFQIGADMMSKMGKRSWYEAGMMFWDLLNALIIYVATLLIALPAGAMVIAAKVLLSIMLGIGPFFIAMLLFGQITAQWFDRWFGQVMTYIMQIALITTVLSMGVKFFSTLAAEVLATNTDHPMATMLEILLLSGVVFYMLQKAYEVGGALAGGVATAGITLRQMAQGAVAPGAAINNMVNPVTTRRDLQSGMMTTARASNHWVAGNTMWNPAYRQHIKENVGKNWGPAKGGEVKGG
ncbi:TPA: type IV secretion system protein [Klebsiella pneumoniae]|uniref:Integral inner membrane protein of type IV secretion complex VirB6 n=2 Tax=Pseudomonadota TaxID=1224 RepID=A0A193PMH1_ALCXX|nr:MULTISPECIES: type IV secretion system protein [Pseudomonadota]HDS2402323.1 type IV secretion system protein [Klebsiella pneumoniae subsp. pneumoniae]HDS2422935.1 type IV secretion system protein [Klebsiella pneumoniae subsp. ozaenae]HDS2474787.1 type IV secretion system protein [Klebsiella pneumoniae]BAV17705.1 integral inner membrane protein of type IV secretion complex VirB6 [Achromobacter xylosoxidans]BCM64611.1 type IV secretion system protein [Enterobacter roggenkampii]